MEKHIPLQIITKTEMAMLIWVKMRCVLSFIRLFAIPWTVARQALLSMELSRQEILEWVAISSSRRSSGLRDQIHVYCISCNCQADSLPLSHLGSLTWGKKTLHKKCYRRQNCIVSINKILSIARRKRNYKHLHIQ